MKRVNDMSKAEFEEFRKQPLSPYGRWVFTKAHKYSHIKGYDLWEKYLKYGNR